MCVWVSVSQPAVLVARSVHSFRHTLRMSYASNGAWHRKCLPACNAFDSKMHLRFARAASNANFCYLDFGTIWGAWHALCAHLQRWRGSQTRRGAGRDRGCWGADIIAIIFNVYWHFEWRQILKWSIELSPCVECI